MIFLFKLFLSIEDTKRIMTTRKRRHEIEKKIESPTMTRKNNDGWEKLAVAEHLGKGKGDMEKKGRGENKKKRPNKCSLSDLISSYKTTTTNNKQPLSITRKIL